MKIIKKILALKNNTFFIQSLVFLGFFYIAFIANHFPKDSFVVGGDFYQVINPASHLSRYFYIWINQLGQGAYNTMWMSYPFYIFLSFFDRLGLGSNIMSGLYIFLQLYLSYLSFYISIKLLYPNVAKHIRLGGGLVYALNNFTFTIFTYPWGFTHHFLFYIFIPPLLLGFLKILMDEKISSKSLIYFGALFLLSTMAYNNLAFLVLLFFAQFIFALVFIFTRQIKLDKKLFIKIGIIALIYMAFASWLFISQYLETPSVQKIYSNKVFGENYLTGWILLTSNSFLNTFLLVLDQNRFPVLGKSIFTFLSTAYFAVILGLFLFLNKKYKSKKVIFSVALLLMIFTFLSMRAYGPFKEIGLFLYRIPPLVLFRSPEKIFSFVPFLYTALLVGLLYALRPKKKIVYAIFAVLLIIPPFYTSKIYEILAGKNNPGAQYNYVIKIPNEYYEARDVINQDARSGSVISLPYSVKNSVNWSQYPKWNFIGQDMLHLLYNKFYISANSYDHPTLETKLSFREFDEQKGSSDELLSMIQKFSGIYIFYHKDIESELIKNSEHTKLALETLERKSKIQLVASNSFFDLYRIRDDKFSPLIDSESPLTFEKINPVKYKIQMNIKEKSNLEFHQSYTAHWNLYLQANPESFTCVNPNYYDNARVTECAPKQKFFEGDELSYFWKKSIFEQSHTIANDYANSWVVDPEYIKANYPASYYTENPDGSITVEMITYFKTQTYFYAGIMTNVFGALGFFGYLAWSLVRGQKRYFQRWRAKWRSAANEKQEAPLVS